MVCIINHFLMHQNLNLGVQKSSPFNSKYQNLNTTNDDHILRRKKRCNGHIFVFSFDFGLSPIVITFTRDAVVKNEHRLFAIILLCSYETNHVLCFRVANAFVNKLMSLKFITKLIYPNKFNEYEYSKSFKNSLSKKMKYKIWTSSNDILLSSHY